MVTLLKQPIFQSDEGVRYLIIYFRTWNLPQKQVKSSTSHTGFAEEPPDEFSPQYLQDSL